MSSNGDGVNGQTDSPLVTGQWVRLSLETPDVAVEGQIFAYDETTNCVVLQSPAAARDAPNGQSGRQGVRLGKFDFHFLKISAVKDVVPISPPAGGPAASPASPSSAADPASELVPVGNLNIDKVIQRENAAVRLERERLARIGVGVTKEAQHIFDALAKTMPCAWSGEIIVVLEQVAVAPPYGVDHVRPIKGAEASKNTLERVKLVLTKEKSRLGLGEATKG
ncbi:anticodon-binding domain-containing protein [Hyaloraphidium curvatum]|nr:anticodon-binding domain-containing protein [Hyaloraphidium curvatum]